ncbi:hypothetical protein [Paenibacillus dokdonensis]|uniref:hypothetical protein n=1 Tax=Paenibacillus dokdonensis TaxID=2567944 RepID=UPI0010A76CEC|nr:hypothetical protein [Paenibacillus dokdonensis]
MLTEFIKQTTAFLQKTDIRLHETEIRQIIFEDDKHLLMTDMFADTYGIASISENYILVVILFFSVLDGKVDMDFPHLEGESYYKKYKELPKSIDDEIIHSQIFRILKALRNASIHSKTAFEVNGNILTCSYTTKRDTPIYIEITTTGLELVFTVVLQLLSPIQDYRNQSLRRSYYDDIKSQTITFTDECESGGLLDITNEIRLKRGVRYHIKNPTFNVGNDFVQITRIYNLDVETQLFQSCDYEIQIGGTQYIVPSEVLDSSNKVSLVELTNWKS